MPRLPSAPFICCSDPSNSLVVVTSRPSHSGRCPESHNHSHNHHVPSTSLSHHIYKLPTSLSQPSAFSSNNCHSFTAGQTRQFSQTPSTQLRLNRMSQRSPPRGRGRGGGRPARGQPREVQVSKQLAYLLRHGAERESINIDNGGWVNVAEVVSHGSCLISGEFSHGACISLLHDAGFRKEESHFKRLPACWTCFILCSGILLDLQVI